jgi:hypothetical protein
MQRGPPRPEPSSEPLIAMTSMPARSSCALVYVALVGHAEPGRDRQRVVAVVPLLAFGGDRVEAGVDDPEPVDPHRLGRRVQERPGRPDHRLTVEARRHRVRPEGVRDVGIHHHGVDVDHRADGVEVHGGALLGDRHRQDRVGQAGGEDPAGQPLGTGRGGALAHPDRQHVRGQQQHVAALDAFQARLVEQLGAGEARVVGVDGPGQRGLPAAGRHGQAGDRRLAAHPERGVAGEQQVGQRVDDEVEPVHQLIDQATGAARAGLDLLVRQPRHQHLAQLARTEVGQVGGDPLAEGVAEPRIVQHSGGQRLPRGRHGQRLIQEFAQVEHLDAVPAQGVREGVVLLLRPAHPGDAVEQQGVVVAGGQPRELGTRPVQHDRGEPADFAVDVVGHGSSLGARGGSGAVAGRSHASEPDCDLVLRFLRQRCGIKVGEANLAGTFRIRGALGRVMHHTEKVHVRECGIHPHSFRFLARPMTCLSTGSNTYRSEKRARWTFCRRSQ